MEGMKSSFNTTTGPILTIITTLNSYFPIFLPTPSLAGHFSLMKQQHQWNTDDETEKLKIFGVKKMDVITLTGVKRAVAQKCTA